MQAAAAASSSAAPIAKLASNLKPSAAAPVTASSTSSHATSTKSSSSSSSLLIGSTKLKYSSNPSPPVAAHQQLKIVAKETAIGVVNTDYRSLLKSTTPSSNSYGASLSGLLSENNNKNSLNTCYASLAHQALSSTDAQQCSANEELMMTTASLNPQAKVNDLVINTADHHANGVGGVTTSGVFSSSSSSSSSAGTGSSSSSSSLILSSPTTSPSRNSIQIHHIQQQQQTNIQIPLQIKRQTSANLNINIVNSNPLASSQQIAAKPSLVPTGQPTVAAAAASTAPNRYSMSSIPSFARSSFHANPKLAKPSSGGATNNTNVSKIMITEDSSQDGARRFSSLHLAKSSFANAKQPAWAETAAADTTANSLVVDNSSSRKLAMPNQVKLLSGAKSCPSSTNKPQPKLDELDQVSIRFLHIHVFALDFVRPLLSFSIH